MVNEILESLLKGEVEIEDVIRWLKNESTESLTDLFTKNPNTQAAFIENFILYLYDKTTWVLNKYSNDCSSVKVRQRYYETELDTNKMISGLRTTPPQNKSDSNCWKRLSLNSDDTNQPSTSGLHNVGRDNKNEHSRNSSICMSPVSPAVQGRKSWSENRNRNSTPKSKTNQSMCLGDFIVIGKSSSKKKKGKQKCNFSEETQEKIPSKDTSIHKELASLCCPSPTDSSGKALMTNVSRKEEQFTNEEKWPSLASLSPVHIACKTLESISLVSPNQPGSNTRSKKGKQNSKGQRRIKFSKDGSLHEGRLSLTSSTPTDNSSNTPELNVSQIEQQSTISKQNAEEKELSKSNSFNEECQILRSPSPVDKFNTSRILQDIRFSKDCQPIIMKRIKPTNLSESSASNSGRVTPQDKHNVFSFKKIPDHEICAENSELQRDSLRQECLKLSSRTDPSDNVSFKVSSTQGSPCIQSNNSVRSTLELVNFKKQLDILSVLYSAFIDLNLVLNVLSTLHYLICLVTVKCDKLEKDECLRDENDELQQNFERLFSTTHNCAYFATSVLNRQSRLLNVFDRPTIKLLLEYSQVKLFSPALIDKLLLFHSIKPERKPDPPRNTAVDNVCFVVDTDNKENFNSVPSFQAFRKQRDLFCSLLDIWKTNYMKQEFRFAKVLGDKIRCLHYMHPDPVNCMHLARLFKNMLLKESTNTPAPNSLNQFANIDAEKLNRLEDRLTSKRSTDGLRPEPSFPGNQEFYKDFIKSSNSHIFHRHLRNCLAAEILNLDDTDFWATDVGDSDTAVDAETKKQYVTCVKSTKLLAKFLAFMESLPYRTNKIIVPGKKVYKTQLAIRKHFMPEIHLKQRLKAAIKQGKLTITIPWVVEYLATFDYVSLRLPYFSETIQILYDIHNQDKTMLGFLTNVEGSIMINMCLGWLFEQCNFPIETYHNFLYNKYKHLHTPDDEDDIVDVKLKYGHSVDLLDIIDETALYTCCPYLYEIRNLLNSNAHASAVKSGPPRFIRPIAAGTSNTEAEEKKKKLQNDMEELFYQNHPASVRRIVEFVSERVTSAVVKFISNNLIPRIKKQAIKVFKKHLEHLAKIDNYHKKRVQLNTCCRREAAILSWTYIEKLKSKFNEEMPHQVNERCTSSMKALFADEIFATIGPVCIEIAGGHSKKNITNWWLSHANREIFQKEFATIIDKLSKEVEPRMARVNCGVKTMLQSNSFKVSSHIPPLGWVLPHDTLVKGPTQLMMDTQLVMIKIAESPDEITYEELKFALDDARNTLSHRCDYSAKTVYQLCEAFYRMALSIVLHAPHLGKTPIFLETFKFWKQYLIKKANKRLFGKIICKNNLLMFLRSKYLTETWNCLARLVLVLLEVHYLTDKAFGNEAFRMFQIDWPHGTAKYFCEFIQTVIDTRVKTAGSNDYTFCLSWLANFSNDDNFFD